MAPKGLSKVFFCNSGSEAADTALKIALAYHRARGEAQRTVFVGREKAYHGVGFGGMSVGGIPANRHAFSGALLPRVDHLQFPHDGVNHAYVHNTEPVWAAAQFEALMGELEGRIIPLHGAGNIAAVMVERFDADVGRIVARRQVTILGARQEAIVLELADGLTVTLPVERALIAPVDRATVAGSGDGSPRVLRHRLAGWVRQRPRPSVPDGIQRRAQAPDRA